MGVYTHLAEGWKEIVLKTDGGQDNKQISNQNRLLRRKELSHPDPERAINFTLQLMHSGWANDVLHHQVKDITGQETGEALIEDLTEACLSYLGLTSPKARR